MFNTAAIKALNTVAPAVGNEFHVRDFMAQLDGCSKHTIAKAIRALETDGYVAFTGQTFLWKRVK